MVKKNNKIIFSIFALLIVLLVGLFGLILYEQIVKKAKTYLIPKNSFGYDINNDHFTIESNAKVSKKWDEIYYLSYLLDGEVYEKSLGSDNVIYNESDDVYG